MSGSLMRESTLTLLDHVHRAVSLLLLLLLRINLEDECFVEDRVKRLAVNFGLHLLLLVGHDVDLDVRVRRATHVHRRQLGRLDHSHRQLHTHTHTHL